MRYLITDGPCSFNHFTNLSKISDRRSEIMGFAILWIMIFHFPSICYVPIFSEICQLGYGGVDIFLFLSGYGLYYGSKKNVSTKDYYKRRFLRIIPTYVLFVVLSEIISHKLSTFTIFKVLILDFWITGRGYWYIPAQILLYLLFPLIIGRFNMPNLKKIFILSIFISLITVALIDVFSYSMIFFNINRDTYFLNYNLFFSRIPIFILGVCFGYLSYNKMLLSIYQTRRIIRGGVFSLLLLIIMFYISNDIIMLIDKYTSLRYFLFLIIAPFICIFLSEHISNRLLLKFFRILGKITLELYLINGFILEYLKMNNVFYNNWLGFFIVIFGSIVISFLFHEMMTIVNRKVETMLF